MQCAGGALRFNILISLNFANFTSTYRGLCFSPASFIGTTKGTHGLSEQAYGRTTKDTHGLSEHTTKDTHGLSEQAYN